MKKPMLVVVTLAMVVAATVPSLATSYVYGSCAEIPTQEEAQQALESPTYGISPNPIPGNPPEDPINLDPDGDGIACNNDGNFAADDFTVVNADRYNAAQCPFPVIDPPATSCTVDENGFITTPDGTKVLYNELSDEPLYDTYTGNLVKFVDSEPVIVEYGQLPPPVVPEYIPPEICAVYSADGRCETFQAPYE
jgi:hypothetical protein